MKDKDKEWNLIMESVARRTESLQRALQPLLQQLILIDIHKENMPYQTTDLSIQMEHIKELESYLKRNIDLVLGFDNLKRIKP